MRRSNRFYIRKTPAPSLSLGGATILVIFIVLCLLTFASLSLVSAFSDLSLSEKTAQRTTDYYAAVSQAHQELAQMAAQPRVTTELADFLVEVDEGQSIHVIASLPESGSSEQVKIISFRIENQGEEESFDIEQE